MDVGMIGNGSAVGTLSRHAASKGAEGFAVLMQQAATTEDGLDAQAREAAQQLVASALVLPLLAEARSEPTDAKLFHGGLAEDSFRSQLDGILADRIVKNEKFPLVDRIYEHVTRRSSGAQAVNAAAGVDTHG